MITQIFFFLMHLLSFTFPSAFLYLSPPSQNGKVVM